MKKLLLIMFSAFTFVAAQQLSLTQDTISTKSSFNSKQFFLKDQQGKIHLVYTGQTKSSLSAKEIYYAVEEADTFSTINLTDNKIEENFPCLSFDKNDNVHITFLSRDTSRNFQIKYTNNTKGHFAEPISITSDRINKAEPVSVVSPDSIVHIVYFTNTYSENKIFYLQYNLKTNIVANPVLLGAGDPSGENDLAIVLDKKGRVHIVFKAGNSKAGGLKYFSNLKGTLKEYDLEIERKIISPKIVVDRFNAIFILYKDAEDNRLYLINNFAGHFNDLIAVTPSNQNPEYFNNFSVDERERFYFVYQSSDSLSGVAFYLVHGTGKEFCHPIKIQGLNNPEIYGNSAGIIGSGNGQISILLSISGGRNYKTVADLILRKGYLFSNAQFKVERDSLIFHSARIGDTSYVRFNVKNPGTGILKLFSADMLDPAFSTEPTDTIYIKPDSTKSIRVYFHPSDTLKSTTVLKFNTNCINAKLLKVHLAGKGLGVPKLFFQKDTLIFIEEKNFIDSVLIINKGIAPLKIDSVKHTSRFKFNVSPQKVEIKPQDSVYLSISLDHTSESIVEHFIDSLLVYSNDPHNPISKFILHSKQDILSLDEDEVKSELYQLQQNYPNPFNPQTTISFTISNQAHVTLRVFDALAREIATLVDENLSAGVHNVLFNGEQLSTGVYYYKLQVKSNEKNHPDYLEVRKMILVK
ncbi:MAG: T9SS type A sorting domain-containing protein [Ignavibacteriales bacterium]|nr:T9SS type A sorting domain-containing protein [Ignavibacteriales bacterium]